MLRSVPYLFIGFLTAVPMMIGCSKVDRSSSGHADDANDDHQHHFVPPHKPSDFADLVADLAFRFGNTASGPELNVSKNVASADSLSELADIIGWIPELAADSELRRPQFEIAQNVYREMSREIADPIRRGETPTPQEGFVASQLDILNRLVPDSQVSAEGM